MPHFIHRLNDTAVLVTTDESENLTLLCRMFSELICLDLLELEAYFMPNKGLHNYSEIEREVYSVLKQNNFNHHPVIYFYLLNNGI